MHSARPRANWDDLRYVLAVAEAGSVSAAARDLGVNHATVLRRVAAWEEAFGAEVFERGAQGYHLRPDRVALIEAARSAAEAMARVGQMMGGTGPGGGEPVRITSTDSLCQAVLAPAMGRIAAQVAPDRVALLAGNAHLDLARLQAEVSVRPAQVLPEGMAGEAAGVLGFAVYARPGAAARWLGLSGAPGRSAPARWMAGAVDPEAIVASADSFLSLRDMARAGLGRAVLPCILGDRAEGLERVEAGMPRIEVPVWVACHADLAQVPRFVRLRQALREVLDQAGGLLRGA